jgi:hypothetical protein
MGNLRNQVSKLTKENKKLESNRKREVLKLKSTCAKLKKLHKESLTVYCFNLIKSIIKYNRNI